MKTGLMSLCAAAMIGAGLLSGTAAAAERQIGVATYDLRANRDTVEIGGKAGQFKAIRLEVRGSDVEILDLSIVYGNGAAEPIKVRQVFKAGSSSRVIDLAGASRAIKQINVTYIAKAPAKIVFFGIEGNGGAAGGGWDRLGCKEVSFGIDRDTVKVGRGDGTFTAIRLRVRKAPIEIFGLRVTFGNGQKQELNVRAVIRDGGETRAIDLAGGQRGIDKVDLLYKSVPTFKGKAEVCVDGLQK